MPRIFSAPEVERARSVSIRRFEFVFSRDEFDVLDSSTSESTLDDAGARRVIYYRSGVRGQSNPSSSDLNIVINGTAGTPLGGVRSPYAWIEEFRDHRSHPSHSIAAPNRHPPPQPITLCDPIVKGSFIVSESKDISRQRLADFLAARLRARAVAQPEQQRTRTESSAITSSHPDEHVTPVSDS